MPWSFPNKQKFDCQTTGNHGQFGFLLPVVDLDPLTCSQLELQGKLLVYTNCRVLALWEQPDKWSD